MFTDIHTHAFHPKIARHAVEHLNEAYQLDCVGEGTIADLLLREIPQERLALICQGLDGVAAYFEEQERNGKL